jgi:hypothetical protein
LRRAFSISDFDNYRGLLLIPATLDEMVEPTVAVVGETFAGPLLRVDDGLDARPKSSELPQTSIDLYLTQFVWGVGQ